MIFCVFLHILNVLIARLVLNVMQINTYFE